MRAIQNFAFGEPTQTLKLVDLPEPEEPGADEVLVAMEFAPINGNDLLVVKGVFAFRPQLPAVAGNEGVAKVLAVGPGVTNVRVGDRVLPPLYGSTWVERLLIPAKGLFALPEEVDPQQLAMLRINPPTAALLLSQFVDLQPGDWIIQNAANSGVGRAVIAIAKSRGLKSINLVRRPELIEELQASGGDVVLLDEPGSAQKASAHVGDGKVRLAIDGISGIAGASLIHYLSPGATLVTYALMSGEFTVPVNVMDTIFKRITVKGFFQSHPQYDALIPDALKGAVQLLADGLLHAPVAAVYPMSEIKQAVAHAERGGKVLLDIQAS